MKLELDPEEVRQMLDVVVDRLIAEADLPIEDAAQVKRWRSEAMRPGSQGMRELTAKVNEDLERALRSKEKSAVRKPDWL